MINNVNQPLLNGREKELLSKCIESGWISSDGPFVKQFEDQFSAYIGTTYGIAVSNGTAALEAAMYAIDINPGDEVILPSFTIISCAIAIIRFGGVPVFVDIEADTWNIDTDKIKEKITSRTKAIMAVHMYGHPCNLDPIMQMASENNIMVIEDSSQVHGAYYKDSKCGSVGHISTFSFYANKIITTGEGGMVLTSDPCLAERVKSYRNLCFRPERRFYHTELGNNLRMTNMQGALGVAQLERLDEFINLKRTNGFYYMDKLSRIDGIKHQIEMPWARMVFWMYCIEIDDGTGITADVMMKELEMRGIATRPFFIGLHDQPVIKRLLQCNQPNEFPITEKSSRQGLYLPSSVSLKFDEIDYVVSQVSNIISGS